jgi:2-polyprenyl-3-methyl-5-hydroxy-6-metoxy-1,4-benzoquinol methylase
MKFEKYNKRGAYHWGNISHNPFKANSFVKQRYMKCMQLLKNNCKSGKVLDVGCGDGAMTYMLFKDGYEASGVDISEKGIELAVEMHTKNNTNCIFHCEDIKNLPSQVYDGLICSDVIEHVENPQSLIEESLRVVKKGGCIVFSTPVRITEHPLDKEHLIEWFPDEWKALFSDYDNVTYAQSHPVALMELMNWGKLRIVIQFLSLFKNIFFIKSRFRYFSLQYAIIKK